jgi:integrase/recombinase XerC
VQLNCFDLDIGYGTVKVLGKGKAERIVPVGSYALRSLRIWLRRRAKIAKPDEPALFVGRRGQRLGSRAVQLRVAYWAQRKGITVHVHPHLFRHACATHVLERCGDIRAVQELLGHVSISTTAIYTHLNFENLAKTYTATHPRARRQISEPIVLRDQRGGDRQTLRRGHQDGQALETRYVPSAGNSSHDSVGQPGTP